MSVIDKHQLLFVSCTTKDMLRDWVHVFLGLDMPDCIVDVSSNSTPMDMLWEIYQKAMDGSDPEYTQVLLYSARDAFKSLTCSILEILALFHFRRNCVHLAAVESQSRRTVQYLNRYFSRSVLREYLVSENKRTIEVAWYENTEERITPKKYKEITDEETKSSYKECKYQMQVLVATLSGVNSPHCSMVFLDELDLAPSGPLEEAKMIPAPGEERGELPITFSTSSRKFAFGNVQKAIDKAPETGLIVRHWSIIDVTQRCPAARHRPDLPKLPIYTNDKLLSAIPQSDYDKLPEEKKEGYRKDLGYNGCMTNCKLWAACKGQLATKQNSTSRLLKPIDHVQGLFRNVSVDYAKAQLLCQKPSLEGMIYPNLDPETHLLSANKIAEMLEGFPFPENFSKEQLIQLLISRDVRFCSGLDHGYTHDFAVVVGAIDGNRCFIIEAHEAKELELAQKIEFLGSKIKRYEPTIYPDTSYPADNKTIKKHGFRVANWHKYPGSVVDGIETVRMKLRPIVGNPQLFFLKGDFGCENAFKKLSTYHWATDSQGNVTDVPDDSDDHTADAVRYMIMNVFSTKKKISVSKQEETNPLTMPQAPVQNKHIMDLHWDQLMQQASFKDPADQFSETEVPETKGKKGSFKWSF